jgi:hypothetical protein
VVVHQDNRSGGGDDGQAEDSQRVNQDRVVSSERNDLVRFDAAAGVNQQNSEALALRVEIRILLDVQAPVLGGFLRCVAKLQGVRCGAFAERDDFVFVGLRSEFERFDEVVHSGKVRGEVHGIYGSHGSNEGGGRRGPSRTGPCPPYLVNLCCDLFGGAGGAVVPVGITFIIGGGFRCLGFFLTQGCDGTGEPDFILLLWLLLAPWECLSARVLPAFAGVVPMETKLRKVGAYGLGGLFGKGDPDPLANYFGQFVLFGHPAAEFFEDFFDGQFPVEIALGKIHKGFDLARGRRSEV